MYIPFQEKQSTNAWQLAVLPCVFGMLFYCTGMGSIVLLSAAAALLAFALTGGLRACAMGLDLFLACMAGQAFYYHLHPFGYLNYVVFLDSQEVLTAALSACTLVLLARILLPKKVLTPDARANFKLFFWIAGAGVTLFVCVEALLFLLGRLSK